MDFTCRYRFEKRNKNIFKRFDYVQSSNTGWFALSNSVGSGETELVSQIAYSLFPNLDTYESINGFPSTLDSISIGV